MSKWSDSFDLITSSIYVNGDDKADDFEELSNCNCKPEFAGGPICFDRSCLNFALYTECVRCRNGCQNNRIRKKKHADLEVRETSWKGHGLFTNQDLKKGQFLMEYLGELISAAELETRMDASLTDKHLYVLQLKPGNFIDARTKGTIGRFINHSCEPNCKTEIWTVDGRLKVGIFAMKDVEKDSELNFDYQWSPSRRPPTKCHCGTASCRGFLEVMTAQEIEDSKVRKGLWRSKKDDLAVISKALKARTANNTVLNSGGASTSTLQSVVTTDSEEEEQLYFVDNSAKKEGVASAAAVPNNVFDSKGALVPSKMVGKRVRIWWEGNQAYFEADVMEFVEKTGRYKVHYVVDQTDNDENLGSDSGPDWSWLDETQNEVVIRKKDLSHLFDGEAVEDQTSAFRQPEALQPVPSKSSSMVEQTRVVMSVRFKTALHVVTTSWANGRTAVTEEMKNDRRLVWSTLFSLLHEYYAISASHYKVDNMPHSVHDDTLQIVLFGNNQNVYSAKDGITTAHSAYIETKKHFAQREVNLLLARQSVVLTNDWRLVPSLASTAGAALTQVSSILQDSVAAIGTMPQSGSSFTIDQKQLPKIPVTNVLSMGSSGGAPQGVTDNVRGILLTHLKGLTKRLAYSASSTFSVLALLLRYLRYCDDSVVKDTTNVIAAVVLIVAKMRGNFRVKQLRKFVQAAYCQVFNREESTVGHSADTFITRVLEIEQIIYSKLRFDVFVPDSSCLVIAAAYQSDRVQRMDDIPVDKHAKHSKHTNSRSDEAQRTQQEYSDLLEEGAELANTLLMAFPSLLQAVPSETLAFTSVLLVALLTTLLTPNSVLRYMLTNQAPSAVVGTLIAIAREYEATVTWTMDLFIKLVMHIFPSIEGVRCLQNKEKHENTPIATLITECVPKLLQKWLRLPVPAAPAKAPAVKPQEKVVTAPMPPRPPPSLPAAPQFVPPAPVNPYAAYQQSVAAPANPYAAYQQSVAAPANLYYQQQPAGSVYGFPQPPVYGGYPAGPPGYPPMGMPPPPQVAPPPVPAPKQPTPPPPPSSSARPKPKPKASPPTNAAFRLRLPWLAGGAPSVAESTLQLTEMSDVSQLTKEVYGGVVAVSSLSRLNAAHICASILSSASAAEEEGATVPISFRAWPSLKTLMREIKKSAVTSTAELGSPSSAVSELCVFQHIHYHFKKAVASSAEDARRDRDDQHFVPTTCPYVAEPFGVLSVPPSEWHTPANSQLLFGNKFDANHEYLRALTDAEDLNLNSSYSSGSSAFSRSTTLGGSWKDDLLGVLNDDRQHSTAAQINAIRSKQYSLPDVSLSFLLFPPVHLVLQSVIYGKSAGSEDGPEASSKERRKSGGGGGSSAAQPHTIRADLAVQLCRDLICAVDHLIYCGVYLKFLSLDHLFVTSDGRLQIGNLSGAVMANNASSAPTAADEMAEAAAAEKAAHKSSKSHKHKHVESVSSKKKDGSSNSALSNVPHSSFYSVAPEILLGGNPSPDTTIYSAGSICTLILTGKPLFKNVASEEKQLQYIYRVLGTPKIVGYKDFDQLPLAATYGRHIKADDDTLTESRSRAFKVVKALCPAPLLSEFSFKASVVSTALSSGEGGKAGKEAEESDGGGVVDLVKAAVHLVPHKRLLPCELLRLPVFSFKVLAAERGHTSLEELSRNQLHEETLELSHDQSVVVQSLTAENRLAAMRQIVKHYRSESAAEDSGSAARDELLFGLAEEKYSAQQFAPAESEQPVFTMAHQPRERESVGGKRQRDFAPDDRDWERNISRTSSDRHSEHQYGGAPPPPAPPSLQPSMLERLMDSMSKPKPSTSGEVPAVPASQPPPQPPAPVHETPNQSAVSGPAGKEIVDPRRRPREDGTRGDSRERRRDDRELRRDPRERRDSRDRDRDRSSYSSNSSGANNGSRGFRGDRGDSRERRDHSRHSPDRRDSSREGDRDRRGSGVDRFGREVEAPRGRDGSVGSVTARELLPPHVSTLAAMVAAASSGQASSSHHPQQQEAPLSTEKGDKDTHVDTHKDNAEQSH